MLDGATAQVLVIDSPHTSSSHLLFTPRVHTVCSQVLVIDSLDSAASRRALLPQTDAAPETAQRGAVAR